MKKYFVITLGLLFTAAVFAQEDKLAMLDTDSDGKISVEEAASDAELSAVFAELDINKDGFLTASELAER